MIREYFRVEIIKNIYNELYRVRIKTTDPHQATTTDSLTKEELLSLSRNIKEFFSNDFGYILPSKASRTYKIGLTTLWRWNKSGKIKSYIINGKKMFAIKDIEEVLSRR